MENCAEKISKQLDEVVQAKPRMYNKTKERYKQLAYSLLRSVDKISSILEDASLVPDDTLSSTIDEFEELKGSIVTDSVDLKSTVEDVRNHISSYTVFQSPSVDKQYVSVTNKDIISKFAVVLKSASEHQFKYLEVTECASLIYSWFKYRFVPDTRNKHFKYNIEQIPTWIYYITILYGKHQSEGTLSEFLDKFDSWISEVRSNDKFIWAVPYEVQQLKNCVRSDMYTINAVIIYDILMEEFYYLLSEDQFKGSKVVLDPLRVSQIVKSFNPHLVPKIRSRISNQNNLIQDCGLTIYKGELLN